MAFLGMLRWLLLPLRGIRISAGGSRFAHAAKTPQIATYPLDPLDPLDPLNSLKINGDGLADSSGLGHFLADMDSIDGYNRHRDVMPRYDAN